MRVLVSVDMEGIAGVVDIQEIRPGEPEYERSRVLMTEEANAAVRGVLAVHPTAQVIISDAHAQFRNLLPERLDRRASLARGKPKPFGMMTGVDAGVQAVVFIGYHGKEGTGRSVLAHTVSGQVINDVRCNGRSLGEIGLNAALAGHFGAPVLLAVGDDTVASEIGQLIPGVKSVVVKQACGGQSAISLHPEEARARIEAALRDALSAGTQPFTIPGPVALEVDVHRPWMTEWPVLIPGVTRTALTTVRYNAETFADAYHIVELIAQLNRP